MKYGSLKWAFQALHDLDDGWTELFGPFKKSGSAYGIGRDEDPPLYGGLTDEQKGRQRGRKQ